MAYEAKLVKFFHCFRDVDPQKLHPMLKAKLRQYQTATFCLAAALFLPLIYLRLWSLPVYLVMGTYGYWCRRRLGSELEKQLSPYRNTRDPQKNPMRK